MPHHPTTDDQRREWRRTVGFIGAVLLGLLFLTGFLPARRDVRTMQEAETALRGEIRMLHQVNRRLRTEIRAAREDPGYAEALRRSRGSGRLPDEDEPARNGWQAPAQAGER